MTPADVAKGLSEAQKAALAELFAARAGIYLAKLERWGRGRGDEWDYGEVVDHTLTAMRYLASDCGIPIVGQLKEGE